MSSTATHQVVPDGLGWIFVSESGTGAIEPGGWMPALDAVAAARPKAVVVLRTTEPGEIRADDCLGRSVVPDAATLDALRNAIQTRPVRLAGVPVAAVRLAGPDDAAVAGLTAGGVAQNLRRAAALQAAAPARTLDGWFVPGTADAKPVEPFRIIGIVGSGTMGTCIGQQCAMKGCGVMLHDQDVNVLKDGMETVRRLFRAAMARGELTSAEAHRAIGGMAITTDWRDFIDCDLVIEAIGEDLAAKQKLLNEIAGVVPPGCVLASTAAALPVEQVGAGVALPGRMLGLRFFPGGHGGPLVEIALGVGTTRATAERAREFVRALGLVPVFCKSAPGCFVTRVLFAGLNEACRLWEQGVPAGVIDGALRERGWATGPLRLIDEIGVDGCARILAELARAFPERWSAAAGCRRLADAGWRGRARGAGAGFYAYGEPAPAPNPAAEVFVAQSASPPGAATIADHLEGVWLDEARRCLAEGLVKTVDEADLALWLGVGFPALRGGLGRPA